MAELRYIDDAGNLRVVRVGAEHFLIGRAGTCQIVFVDDMVSREHTRLDRDSDGRYRIRDLGSRNHTVVNGQQVGEARLVSGDVIRVGDHVLEFLDEEAHRERLSLDFLTPDRAEPPGTEWVKIKTPVTLSLEQVQKLAGLSAGAGSVARAEEIADAALSRLILDLQAERAMIARRGESRKEIVPIAHRGLSLVPGGSRMPVSQTFVYASLLQQVAGRYPRNAGEINPKSGFAATAMVAPLLFRRDVIGVVYVDRPSAKQPFSAMALQQMTAAGAAIGAMMAEASRRLTETSAGLEAAWLSTVRRMQSALSVTPKASPPFESAWRRDEGSFRCGDLCDLIQIDDARCVLLMLDGGGGGVAALTQAAAIQAAVRTTVQIGADLTDLSPVMNHLNRAVADRVNRQLVPCTLLAVDVTAGRIAYVNAGGMPPLLLAGPGRLITLEQPSLLLGIDADYTYETASVDLPASFRLVCHSDGLTDSANAAGEVFAEARLHELLLNRSAFAEPAALVRRVSEAVSTHLAGHPRSDDATILVLGRG